MVNLMELLQCKCVLSGFAYLILQIMKLSGKTKCKKENPILFQTALSVKVDIILFY
jgi:hypothetical protein